MKWSGFSFNAKQQQAKLFGQEGQAASPDAGSLAGYWEGAIHMPQTNLAIVVEFTEGSGAWSGTIDIPVQGVHQLKLSEVTLRDKVLSFKLPRIPGDPIFVGEVGVTGRAIGGSFSQAGLTFPFSLERKERPAPRPGDTPAQGVPGTGFVGHWQGRLQTALIGGRRLALAITHAPAGGLAGTLANLDRDRKRFPLTAVVAGDDRIHLTAGHLRGCFDGQLSGDGSEIVGLWNQRGPVVPLVFRRLAQAPRLNRPQEPSRPYPYDEEEVHLENQVARVTLAGTLTLPRDAGPHPAVVLITGSGPQDRDESLWSHKPFLVLADHLTRLGIAVLRCDDRGTYRSTGDFAAATHADFVDDALAAIGWMKTHPRIDPRRIGLVGHSEGAIVGPLAAIKKPEDVAFLVLLAGVGVPVRDFAIRQSIDLSRQLGMDEPSNARNTGLLRELLRRLLGPITREEAEQAIRETLIAQTADVSHAHLEALGLTDDFFEWRIRSMSSPSFRQLLAYDPAETLRQVRCPVLALNGEKDVQVAAKENLDGMAEALSAGGNSDATTMAFPSLNHLFQTCVTGSISEYVEIEETFSPKVLDVISKWILQRFPARDFGARIASMMPRVSTPADAPA